MARNPVSGGLVRCPPRGIIPAQFSGTKMARMISFLRVHKRAITFSLVAFCFFLLTLSLGEMGFYFLLFFALLLIFIASQIFWIGRILDLGERFIPGKPRR